MCIRDRCRPAAPRGRGGSNFRGTAAACWRQSSWTYPVSYTHLDRDSSGAEHIEVILPGDIGVVWHCVVNAVDDKPFARQLAIENLPLTAVFDHKELTVRERRGEPEQTRPIGRIRRIQCIMPGRGDRGKVVDPTQWRRR